MLQPRLNGIACASLAVFLAFGSSASPSEFVDPLIGARGAGGVVVGPCMPFGMAKPSPDVGRNDSNSGWAPDSEV